MRLRRLRRAAYFEMLKTGSPEAQFYCFINCLQRPRNLVVAVCSPKVLLLRPVACLSSVVTHAHHHVIYPVQKDELNPGTLA